MARSQETIMKSYVILIFIAIALFSCEQDEFPIIESNIVVTEPCLDTCGIIIACKHFMNEYPAITSVLTVSTSCDTLEVIKIHTLEEIQYYSGMEVCFIR